MAKKKKTKAAPKKTTKPAKKVAKKKPAPKKAAKKPAPAKKKESVASKALDWARSSGIKTASRTERTSAAKRVEDHAMFDKTHKAVLSLFRSCYPSPDRETDETILETDPNDFDMDPSPFYETVEERFGVPQDPDNEYFGGYGGPIRDLIAFLTPRWDGKLRTH